MGDRISIQYKNGDEKSVILFSHWQGKSLKEKVLEHYQKVVKPLHDQNGGSVPLSRMEPCTVIVDFIRFLVSKDPFKPIEGDLYLVGDINDGDNSDNGHYLFDLKTGKFTHIKGEFE
jgi:hypothetical protein